MRGENKECCAQKQISRVGKPAGDSYQYFLEYFCDCGEFNKAALSRLVKSANLITYQCNWWNKTHGLLKPTHQCRIMLSPACVSAIHAIRSLWKCTALYSWLSAGGSQINTIFPITPIASCCKEDVTTSPPSPSLHMFVLKFSFSVWWERYVCLKLLFP